ncbi:F-box/kelch-repeat protein At3g23880-like [Alnus glutinosa]|uniref:F-box/kelch-repeat protein At3g23880-like n=1 Tax=Alnus glutinosa TaxID=3517 RepID=UPI002D78BA14|nr:F-box/kelch-repeat protein At3g23880-like [Alnus glutinosa]
MEQEEANEIPSEAVFPKTRGFDLSKKEEEAKEMSDFLPSEVLVDILIRLPVKSLVRLRCVCKDWCSLISSNTFITTHTHTNRHDNNNSRGLLLFRYAKTILVNIVISRQYENFSLRTDDGSFGNNNNFIQLNCPLKPPASCSCYYFTNIVGSWNGLFCFAFSDHYRRNGYGYTLWNPSIHRALSLPEPNFNFSSHGRFKHSHGFGLDPSSNDMKLVRLVYLDGHEYYYKVKVPPLVEIYTLNTGCWRAIAAPAPSYIVNERCLSVFVNGASHWVAHTPPEEGTFRNVIVAFDMVDEVFHEIAVPDRFVGKLYLNMTVAVLDGLLCLVPFNERKEEQSFSIWIMKEYGIGESWTKLFNIHISQGLKRVVAFRKNGEVLVTDRKGELLSYEPHIKRATQLGFLSVPGESETGTRYCEDWFYLDKYTESLVLLNAKNGVSGR